MRIDLLGKRWTLVRKKLPDDRGLCEHPEQPAKRIVIDSRLTGVEELEVTIHELLHACCWWLDEEYVEKISWDVAKVLWALGWRRT